MQGAYQALARPNILATLSGFAPWIIWSFYLLQALLGGGVLRNMVKFIAPERNPKRLKGSFTTSKGMPETYRDASEGFSRFWTWMQVNVTGLNSFSTDECVDNAWSRLLKLQSDLATYQAGLPSDGEAYQDAEDCRIQLANVMRRRASSRVTNANSGQAKATIEPATKDPTVQALMGLFGMG